MKLLLYCTKSKPYLYFENDLGEDEYGMIYDPQWLLTTDSCFNKDYAVNGKIVAECDFEVEEITPANLVDFEKESCVDRVSMLKYLKPVIWNNKFEILLNTLGGLTIGYAIRLKNLHIFDEPKELSEFYKSHDNSKTWQCVNKAPQNMMEVDYINIENNIFLPYILISIHPEWLCKILNGEKTIEVRKKVLRGMFENL